MNARSGNVILLEYEPQGRDFVNDEARLHSHPILVESEKFMRVTQNMGVRCPRRHRNGGQHATETDRCHM